jgi:hypothetical protein
MLQENDRVVKKADIERVFKAAWGVHIGASTAEVLRLEKSVIALARKLAIAYGDQVEGEPWGFYAKPR